MGWKLFNTLSRSVQDFTPLDPAGRTVGLYCCGPTVYDFAHIGNWRTFVFGDLVRRYLEFKGYTVTHVMNVTDVEDKIIRRVRESHTPLRAFTARYETAFFEDLKTLHCRAPHHQPRATEHIPQIIALIEKLVRRDLAYQASDGSVYFSIPKYRDGGAAYGRLLNLNPSEGRAGERVQTDDYAKESATDFALWKARAPEDGEVFWPSPWGEGRPGWHVECSAMSMHLLGPSFDLHLGGEDLIFPHHEDEIAQSEGATGRPFVKYWLHGAHLLVEGRKMSKSLGNFFTLRDLLDRGFAGREIRYLLLTAHYRETFNFTFEGLQGARAVLGKLDECLAKLGEAAAPDGRPSTAGAPPAGTEDAADRWLARFTAALDEDLNVSAAWAVVFAWIRELNQRLAEGSLAAKEAAAALVAWDRMNSVLGLEPAPAVEVPPDIIALLEDRHTARQAKDYQQADALRAKLRAKGWLVEDTPQGPKVKMI